jgi:multiple sugar transport system permease protein
MAAVRTAGEVIRHRLSIVAVLGILVIMLAPIFWITATAFKPRNLATAVRPRCCSSRKSRPS